MGKKRFRKFEDGHKITYATHDSKFFKVSEQKEPGPEPNPNDDKDDK